MMSTNLKHKHDEQAFVAGLRNGDAASFEYLVRHYGGQMLAVARRYMRNDADASDCVQEAFIQVFKNIDKFEQRASLRSWLHRIVVNASLMKIRADNRHSEALLGDDDSLKFDPDGQRIGREPAPVKSLETLLLLKETRSEVRAAINQLPDHSRNLLLLRDIEGYSTKETASALELSESAVKTGLHRARAALKLLLMPVMHEDNE